MFWFYVVILLPKRDYVTFGSLLSQIRLSVTFVRPTQEVETFGDISLPFCTLTNSFDLRAKCYDDRPRETRPSESVKLKRGISYLCLVLLMSFSFKS